MIHELTLKCFRKVIDDTMIFTKGLNVLRGSNELGKTTRLESIAYALYGSRALRSSLEDAVTWGHKKSELSVKLVIGIGEVLYTFTRSAAGAECNYPGGKVTGQNEVTAFATQLLGADAKTASLLMLASQSGLRGALDEGPTAVSALMGRLADFDLIDRLLTTAQERLLLGAEAPIRGKIDAAEAEVEAANDDLPLSDEIPICEGAVATCTVELSGAEETHRTVIVPALEKAQNDYRAVRARVDERAAVLGAIDEENRHLDDLRARISDLEQRVKGRPAPAEIEAARARVDAASKNAQLVEAYAVVSALPAYPEAYWDGLKGEFDARLRELHSQVAQCTAQVDAGLRERTALEKRRLKPGSDRCSVCGSQIMDPQHVEKHNAELQAQIDVLAQEIARHTESRAVAEGDLTVMKQIVRLATPFEAAASRLAHRELPVMIDMSVYPPRVTWIGEVPGKTDMAALRRALHDLEDQERDAVQHEGRIIAHREDEARTTAKLTLLASKLESLPEVDLAPVEAAYNEASQANLASVGAIDECRRRLADAQAALTGARSRWERGMARLNAASARLREYEDDLKKLAFNNALIKKLKGLKPAITDLLWNQILSAVSSFFSQMRGEQSIVSKNGDGFRVNGQSVESLSGSTLDVLALAIRVALTKTFIPHASFIVLDEPAHGCDTTRTSAVLGFLSAVGCQQVLLASHDALSDSVATNVVLLGE